MNKKICLFTSLVLFAAGCGGGGSNSQPVSLKFAAKVGSEDVQCGKTYGGIGSSSSNINVNDLRFYVTNVRLLDSEGSEHPVELEQDGKWQYQNVALLDFENAAAGCAEQGTAETNNLVRGSANLDNVTGVRFDIGIPFELNHLDPTVSPAPLNVMALGWIWQVGHIFFRADLATSDGAWYVHLGSSGCVSDSFTAPPAELCSNPNISTVTLTNFNPANSVITLDLATLLQGVNVTGVTPDTAPGCMSERNDNECAEVYPNFGLSLDSGKCADSCSNQSGFYLQ